MTHCVITGAADGIGRALAGRFARTGVSVVGVDVDADRAAQTRVDLERKGGTVSFVVADLGTEEGIDRAVEALCGGPAIDVLVYNAGISAVGRFPEVRIDRQRAVIDLNLTAPMVLTAELLKEDQLAPGATLVFVSSLSHFVSYPGAAAYAASKTGLASYARSLSAALADLHVLTVFPGPTRTAHARRYSPDNSREHRRMPPEALADRIYRAVVARKRVLIPGVGNRVFATLGLWFPRVTEWAMRRAILDQLNKSAG